MHMDPRMKKVEEKINTTKFEPAGELRPMRNFYPNTEFLSSSLPSDTDEIILSMSDKPYAAGEVELALPPVPFYEHRGNTVLYQHSDRNKRTRGGKFRPLPNTPELPVTQAYVFRSFLDDHFVTAQKPIYFGISAVTKDVLEDEKPVEADDIAGGDEIDRADALAALADFLRAYVRVKRGARLTSRQIWAMWAKYHNADPSSKTIRGVQLADVFRQFRATFGATAAKDPTRIDGISQRYVPDFAIMDPST